MREFLKIPSFFQKTIDFEIILCYTLPIDNKTTKIEARLSRVIP